MSSERRVPERPQPNTTTINKGSRWSCLVWGVVYMFGALILLVLWRLLFIWLMGLVYG